MNRNLCPNCNKGELEKIEVTKDLEWLMPKNMEAWGCPECGQSFFKKVLDKPSKM